MKKFPVLLLLCLALFLAACSPRQTNIPISSPSPVAREDVPIFPGAEESKDDLATVYFYKISNVDVFDVQRFYKKEMPNDGWEFLSAGDMSGEDIGEAYTLWFAKGEEIAIIELYPRYSTVNVFIHFEQ